MAASIRVKKYFFIAWIVALLILLGLTGCRLQKLTQLEKVFFGLQYVRLNDTLYASATELTIREYKAFLADLEISAPDKLNGCMIDSNAWNIYPDAVDAHLSKNYFNHPAFKHYPVCCISWYGANEYCKWLTTKFNSKPLKPKIVFRLPTENEWRLMARAPDKDGLDARFPLGYDSATQHYQFNYSINDTVKKTAKDGGYFTVDVNSYWVNGKGILNLHGNVAEMTSDQNICKGGSWNDNIRDCSIYVNKHYTLPSAEVGLRVFATIGR